VAEATEDDDRDLADLGITLHDPDGLVLASDRDWALMECGGCAHLSKWQWTQDPFEAREVPHGVETVPRRDVH
jgi:hypothetical protein